MQRVCTVSSIFLSKKRWLHAKTSNPKGERGDECGEVASYGSSLDRQEKDISQEERYIFEKNSTKNILLDEALCAETEAESWVASKRRCACDPSATRDSRSVDATTLATMDIGAGDSGVGLATCVETESSLLWSRVSASDAQCCLAESCGAYSMSRPLLPRTQKSQQEEVSNDGHTSLSLCTGTSGSLRGAGGFCSEEGG